MIYCRVKHARIYSNWFDEANFVAHDQVINLKSFIACSKITVGM